MTRSAPPVRPLLVRFGALGDLITLTACAAALHHRWGEPCDLLTGTHGAGQVFAGLDVIADIVTVGSRRTPFAVSPEQWHVVRWLRRRQASPVYLFEDKPEVADKLMWLLRRGGLRDEDTVGPQQVPRGDLEHFHTYGMRLVGATPPAWRAHLPVPPDSGFHPRLAVSDEEREDCRSWLAARGLAGHPLILLQPHSRRSNRGRWPAARWSALARAILVELPTARILVLGSEREAQASTELARSIADDRAVSAAAELPLRRLFALLGEAHSLISLDTGPAHAAAALECPVVVLVGIADPRRNRPVGPADRIASITAWAPELWPARRLEWETGHDVAGITEDAALSAWRRLAAGHPRP